MNYKLLIALLLLSFSCQDKKKEYKVYNCKMDLQIEMFPDSSFFSDVRCMQYNKENVYVLDANRRDIVVVNENLEDRISVIGTPGSGPQELTNPNKFYVFQDTVYVVDYGAGGIKTLYQNRVINLLQQTKIAGQRFFCTSDHLYVPSIGDSSTFSVISENEEFNELHAGRLVKFETGKETSIRNEKNLLYNGGNSFYAVSDNLTKIEKYDLETLTLISDYDISKIPIVENNLKYISSQPREVNSYYAYMTDSYLANNSLYLLCANIIKPFKVNQVIKISLSPQMKVSAIFTLPGDIYSSFCVSSDHIFAFNYTKATIERIKLPD